MPGYQRSSAGSRRLFGLILDFPLGDTVDEDIPADSQTVLMAFSRQKHPSMSLGTDHTSSTFCHTCTLASSLVIGLHGSSEHPVSQRITPLLVTQRITRRWSPARLRRPTDQQTTTDESGSDFWDQGPHASDLPRLVQLLAHFAFMSQTTNFPAGIRPLTLFSISQDLLSTRGIHSLVYKTPNPSITSPHLALSVFHFPCILFTTTHPSTCGCLRSFGNL